MSGKRNACTPLLVADTQTLWESLPQELLPQILGPWVTHWAQWRLVGKWCCAMIDRLYLTVTDLDEECLCMSDETLRQFPNLNVLAFQSPQVPHRIMTLPVQTSALVGLRRLGTLWLDGYDIRDTDLCQLTQLKLLRLNAVPYITSHGLSTLTNLHTLTFVELDSAVTHTFDLHTLCNLTALDTGLHRIEDGCLAPLTKLTRLRCRELPRLSPDNCLTQLVTLTTYGWPPGNHYLHNLRVLLDQGGCVRDRDLLLMTSLQELDLGHNHRVGNDGLVNLVQLQKLTIVGHHFCAYLAITDAGISHLTTLTDLDIADSRTITVKGLQHMTRLNSLRFHAYAAITKTRHLLPFTIPRSIMTLPFGDPRQF